MISILRDSCGNIEQVITDLVPLTRDQMKRIENRNDWKSFEQATFVAAELTQGCRRPALAGVPGGPPACGRRQSDAPSPGVSGAGAGTPLLPGAPDPKVAIGSGATRKGSPSQWQAR